MSNKIAVPNSTEFTAPFTKYNLVGSQNDTIYRYGSFTIHDIDLMFSLALLSVYDKTDLLDLAKGLADAVLKRVA